MNNKLFARIAAAAISVTMLGTAVFATEPAVSKDDTAQTASLTFVIEGTDISTSTEDQITMMAYLVDAKDAEGNEITTIPAYVDQEIVALDQTAGVTGFATIPLDFAKLASGKKIAVKLGGSDGTVDEYLISYEKGTPVITVSHIIGDVDGDGEITSSDIDVITLYVEALFDEDKNAVNKNNDTSIGKEINLTNEATGSNWIIGDVDSDGEITSSDIDFITLYVEALFDEDKDAVNGNNDTRIGEELTYPEK